jgi:hypothetical protein
MANLFQEVVATQCKGEVDPTCANFAQKVRLPAHKRYCACGSPVVEITRPNRVVIAIVGVAALAILIGAGLAVRSYMLRISSVTVIPPSTPIRTTVNKPSPTAGAPGSPPTPAPGGQPGATQPTAPTQTLAILNWTLEGVKTGSQVELSKSDGFELTAPGTYRSRESFTRGDKFRLHFNQTPDWLYAFYSSGSETRRLLAQEGSGFAVLPSSREWYRLDATPGIEEFLVVCSSQKLESLERLPEKLAPSVLADQLRAFETTKDPTVLRIQVKHD